MSWELTDNDCCQHIRANGTEYEMIQAVWLDRTIEDKQKGLVEYCVVRGSIDLNDYTQEEIEKYLSPYGYETKPEDSIIAECILEEVLMSDEYAIGDFNSFDEAREFIEKQIREVEDRERVELIKLAAKYYIAKTDDEENGGEDIADYSVHDALFDAAMELGMSEVPDYYDGEGEYDCLVEDLKHELGIE